MNIHNHPDVPKTGPDRGREATSLVACGATDADAKAIAMDLAAALTIWADGADDPMTLVKDWTPLVDWSLPLRIRDTDEQVTPIRLESDGRLTVRPQNGGAPRALVAEYLL